MPFHNEPENLGILRSSLIGLKDEPKMIGYGDVFGEELEEGRSSIVQEESILSFDVIGMSKGVSITDKYISSEAMIKPEDKKQKEWFYLLSKVNISSGFSIKCLLDSSDIILYNLSDIVIMDSFQAILFRN